jgi:2-oxo-hept-3-ene-1,7-dioate hydratase
MPADHAANLSENMLDEATIRSLASELEQAEQRREQIPQFSSRYPTMTVADSYAIQKAWMDLKKARGLRAIGHKIGLTSRAMQIAAQITEPDYGTLLDGMLLHDGVEIKTGSFIEPRLEVEFAFVLKRALRGPSVTLMEVMSAVDCVVPALELIDARIERFDRQTKAPRKVLDTIADNAASGAVITGGNPRKAEAVDLRWAGALLYKNGIIEETGLGAGVLNHPGTGVAWLANKLASHDESLAAGEIVLCGSFTRPVDCAAGDVFHADYGSLGTITARFV